jgi:hypothetical protein
MHLTKKKISMALRRAGYVFKTNATFSSVSVPVHYKLSILIVFQQRVFCYVYIWLNERRDDDIY